MLAKEFRRLDQTTPLTIITQADGRFYSKPLLSSAFSYQRTPEALVTASVEEMREQLQADILTHTEVICVDTQAKTLQLKTRTSVTRPYHTLVLAIGAQPRILPLPGDGACKIHHVNDLAAYEQFRAALHRTCCVGIIGCGLVGTEFANDLLAGGHSVSVMAPCQSPIARWLPVDIGRAIQAKLAAAGVKWSLGQSVKAVNMAGKQSTVTLDTGESRTFDVLLSAAGLVPRMLPCKGAKLFSDAGHIAVNRYLQTAAEDVYALGDCATVAGTACNLSRL